jgi:hypothetical protein
MEDLYINYEYLESENSTDAKSCTSRIPMLVAVSHAKLC